ncbi:MAG TPA: hypothetical protein VGL42_03580 [Opitutaceae bacterium]|jgi:hypothetical protein
MAAFIAPKERELLAELKEAAILTPAVIDSMHAALGRAENFSFDEFLLAGADVIDERHWITWLIRHRGCYRFGPVRLAPEARNWPPLVAAEQPLPSNLPYTRAESGIFLVGVLRPDLKVNGYRAAGTLRELRELRTAWRQ